eukprot:GCRY01004329.1.p1 GENE.GCRY01004329.1~~GCRY01004329.1.p1  ORF type:complete len:2127 (+),score=548.75 GCRY01004329.1:134-6514(+)
MLMEDFVKIFDALDYDQRVKKAIEIARTHQNSPEFLETLESLLNIDAVKDDCDIKSGAVGNPENYFHVKHAATVACGFLGKAGVHLLKKQIIAPSLCCKKLELRFLAQHLSDESAFELITKLPKRWSGLLASSCMKERRVPVIDQLILKLINDPVPCPKKVEKILHGGSEGVILKALESMNELTITKHLQRFYPKTVFSFAKSQFEKASLIQYKTLWTKWWYTLQEMLSPSTAPLFAELMVQYPVYEGKPMEANFFDAAAVGDEPYCLPACGEKRFCSLWRNSSARRSLKPFLITSTRFVVRSDKSTKILTALPTSFARLAPRSGPEFDDYMEIIDAVVSTLSKPDSVSEDEPLFRLLCSPSLSPTQSVCYCKHVLSRAQQEWPVDSDPERLMRLSFQLLNYSLKKVVTQYSPKYLPPTLNTPYHYLSQHQFDSDDSKRPTSPPPTPSSRRNPTAKAHQQGPLLVLELTRMLTGCLSRFDKLLMQVSTFLSELRKLVFNTLSDAAFKDAQYVLLKSICTLPFLSAFLTKFPHEITVAPDVVHPPPSHSVSYHPPTALLACDDIVKALPAHYKERLHYIANLTLLSPSSPNLHLPLPALEKLAEHTLSTVEEGTPTTEFATLFASVCEKLLKALPPISANKAALHTAAHALGLRCADAAAAQRLKGFGDASLPQVRDGLRKDCSSRVADQRAAAFCTLLRAAMRTHRAGPVRDNLQFLLGRMLKERLEFKHLFLQQLSAIALQPIVPYPSSSSSAVPTYFAVEIPEMIEAVIQIYEATAEDADDDECDIDETIKELSDNLISLAVVGVEAEHGQNREHAESAVGVELLRQGLELQWVGAVRSLGERKAKREFAVRMNTLTEYLRKPHNGESLPAFRSRCGTVLNTILDFLESKGVNLKPETAAISQYSMFSPLVLEGGPCIVDCPRITAYLLRFCEETIAESEKDMDGLAVIEPHHALVKMVMVLFRFNHYWDEHLIFRQLISALMLRTRLTLFFGCFLKMNNCLVAPAEGALGRNSRQKRAKNRVRVCLLLLKSTPSAAHLSYVQRHLLRYRPAEFITALTSRSPCLGKFSPAPKTLSHVDTTPSGRVKAERARYVELGLLPSENGEETTPSAGAQKGQDDIAKDDENGSSDEKEKQLEHDDFDAEEVVFNHQKYAKYYTHLTPQQDAQLADLRMLVISDPHTDPSERATAAALWTLHPSVGAKAVLALLPSFPSHQKRIRTILLRGLLHTPQPLPQLRHLLSKRMVSNESGVFLEMMQPVLAPPLFNQIIEETLGMPSLPVTARKCFIRLLTVDISTETIALVQRLFSSEKLPQNVRSLVLIGLLKCLPYASSLLDSFSQNLLSLPPLHLAILLSVTPAAPRTPVPAGYSTHAETLWSAVACISPASFTQTREVGSHFCDLQDVVSAVSIPHIQCADYFRRIIFPILAETTHEDVKPLALSVLGQWVGFFEESEVLPHLRPVVEAAVPSPPSARERQRLLYAWKAAARSYLVLIRAIDSRLLADRSVLSMPDCVELLLALLSSLTFSLKVACQDVKPTMTINNVAQLEYIATALREGRERKSEMTNCCPYTFADLESFYALFCAGGAETGAIFLQFLAKQVDLRTVEIATLPSLMRLCGWVLCNASCPVNEVFPTVLKPVFAAGQVQPEDVFQAVSHLSLPSLTQPSPSSLPDTAHLQQKLAELYASIIPFLPHTLTSEAFSPLIHWLTQGPVLSLPQSDPHYHPCRALLASANRAVLHSFVTALFNWTADFAKSLPFTRRVHAYHPPSASPASSSLLSQTFIAVASFDSLKLLRSILTACITECAAVLSPPFSHDSPGEMLLAELLTSSLKGTCLVASVVAESYRATPAVCEAVLLFAAHCCDPSQLRILLSHVLFTFMEPDDIVLAKTHYLASISSALRDFAAFFYERFLATPSTHTTLVSALVVAVAYFFADIFPLAFIQERSGPLFDILLAALALQGPLYPENPRFCYFPTPTPTFPHHKLSSLLPNLFANFVKEEIFRLDTETNEYSIQFDQMNIVIEFLRVLLGPETYSRACALLPQLSLFGKPSFDCGVHNIILTIIRVLFLHMESAKVSLKDEDERYSLGEILSILRLSPDHSVRSHSRLLVVPLQTQEKEKEDGGE